MSAEPTTPDLVELARRLDEAANRMDLDAIVSFYAPDAVWESVGLGTSFEGRTAIRGFWEDMTVAYEDFEWWSEGILDLGNGVVFNVDRASGRPVGSTGRVELRIAIVAVWEGSLVVRGTTYSDIDQARAAAERLAESRRQAMCEEFTTPDVMELVRGTFDAANRRDFDALMGFYAPNALMDATRTAGIAPRGREAIRGLAEEWVGAYEELEWAAEEPVDLGNGVVFAVVSQKASPVGVTGYVQQREGWIWVRFDDLIASVTIYPEADIDEARAAAERLAAERG